MMGTRVGGGGRRWDWDAAVVWLLIALFIAGFWTGVVFAVIGVTS